MELVNGSKSGNKIRRNSLNESLKNLASSHVLDTGKLARNRNKSIDLDETPLSFGKEESKRNESLLN